MMGEGLGRGRDPTLPPKLLAQLQVNALKLK